MTQRLEIGDRFRMSDDHRLIPDKEVIHIFRNCVCSHILSEINGIDQPMAPHMHITARNVESGASCYLNWYSQGEGGRFFYLGPYAWGATEPRELIVTSRASNVQMDLFEEAIDYACH